MEIQLIFIAGLSCCLYIRGSFFLRLIDTYTAREAEIQLKVTKIILFQFTKAREIEKQSRLRRSLNVLFLHNANEVIE